MESEKLLLWPGDSGGGQAGGRAEWRPEKLHLLWSSLVLLGQPGSCLRPGSERCCVLLKAGRGAGGKSWPQDWLPAEPFAGPWVCVGVFGGA